MASASNWLECTPGLMLLPDVCCTSFEVSGVGQRGVERPVAQQVHVAGGERDAALGGAALLELVLEETHTCYLGDRATRHAWANGAMTHWNRRTQPGAFGGSRLP